LRQTSSVLFIDVDSLIPIRGKSIRGLDEFTATLDHQGIPAVWLTSRSRLQFDEPRRKLGHAHPFIAEDGCATYLPEDYFHLRPESNLSKSQKASTIRLGRFTCIPVAESLPAATEALETLSAGTGVPVVPLRSLSLRELVQNTGLPEREAELARQRDFDEVFFLAGVSDQDVQRFLAEAKNRKLQLRQHGVFWSAAIGASTERCVRDLSKLYDRALRQHAHIVGIATEDLSQDLFPFCERTILLTHRTQDGSRADLAPNPKARRLELRTPNLWECILEAISTKKN
jgi:mannosyl-3-phosphoglycerate phosphatase